MAKITNIRCPHCGQVAASLREAEPLPLLPDSQTPEEALKILIAEYPWPRQGTRIINACLLSGWTTFRDLCALDMYELFRTPNLATKSIDEIKGALSKYGLRLGMIDTVK